MDQFILGLQGAYLGVGCVFAAYIISRTWWDHWKTAVPGAVIAVLIVPLWLPAVVIIALLVWWAFWSNARRVNHRFARGERRRHNWMKAIKDKHGVDDEAVTARVIQGIKEADRG